MSRRTTRLLTAAAAALLAITVVQAPSVDAAPDAKPTKADSAAKPYMGWSSWSLESTNYPGVNPTGPASWLNEANVIKQTDVVASTLKSHGYSYVNVDAGWLGGFDGNARPLANATTFPHGMKYLGDYIHRKGLKFGAYLAVGLDLRAYNNGNTPIAGAKNCYTRDLVYPDLRTTNGWNSSYKIDFSNPCSQAYINSIANELAGWGVDFLKLDGVGPGSFQGGANYDNTSDVQAWNTALANTGRKIQFVISWGLSHRQAAVWKANSNGARVETDVECYCDTIVTWNNSVKQRFTDVVQWIPDAGPGYWNNLDSLDVGNGQMDGITDAERQSYMTLWAIEAAPLYAGDDLTKLDSYGLSLLTNDEVIAVDQAGIAAKPLSQSTQQQTWYARNSDGSYTVALFNLGDSTATVTANLAQLGVTGSVKVRDLWSRKDLANVAAHARLAAAEDHADRPGQRAEPARRPARHRGVRHHRRRQQRDAGLGPVLQRQHRGQELRDLQRRHPPADHQRHLGDGGQPGRVEHVRLHRGRGGQGRPKVRAQHDIHGVHGGQERLDQLRGRGRGEPGVRRRLGQRLRPVLGRQEGRQPRWHRPPELPERLGPQGRHLPDDGVLCGR
jgi:hypothetical protein